MAAEAEVEEMKAEAEEEDEGEKKKPEQLDLLTSDWSSHIPAGGLIDFGEKYGDERLCLEYDAYLHEDEA